MPIPWLGSALMGGAHLLGNVFQNVANRRASRRQMEFQERMSNTSYGRLVGDLEDAKLSKVLAFQGSRSGASTPQGAMAQYKNPMENVVNSATMMRKLDSELENVNADTRLKDAEMEEHKERKNSLIFEQLLNAGKTSQVAQEIIESIERTNNLKKEFEKMKSQIQQIDQERKYTKEKTKVAKHDAERGRYIYNLLKKLNDKQESAQKLLKGNKAIKYIDLQREFEEIEKIREELLRMQKK